MRTIFRINAVIGLAVAIAAGAVNANAASPAGVPLQATAKVVVRPVTTAGHASTGYSVTGEPSGQVDCSTKIPSPGAVSPNIEFCLPFAETAIACWKATAPHRVLCIRNPRSKHLVRIPRKGAFASTGLAPRARRAPLEMRLGDGALCSIRAGGTWGYLPGHPKLFGTYGCTKDGAVWASSSTRHIGVNESHPFWTVRTAHFGSHTLKTRRVVRAWFVGTAQG